MHYNQDWDELGRRIQDIVDRAVNSHDYHKLNQTIRQTVGRAVDLGSEAVRKAVDAAERPVYTPAAKPERKALPVLYGRTGGKTAGGILKIVGGSVLSCLTLAVLLSSMILELVFTGMFTVPAVLALGGLVAGVWLICSGAGTLGMLRRFKTYRRILGQRTQCSLEKLARGVGKSVKFVRREVQRMIRDGLFLEGHMDREETCLITTDETYRLFEQSRLQLEQRQRQEAADREAMAASPRNPQIREVLDRGNAFVAQIRRCNDDIPGEEISAKIDRMENIVRRIFRRAETHPEVIPDLKKMMDHYLPMTVKLLGAYADMDAQPVQGETIRASKREIEETLDTLNQAYEKILDDLFADTAMDVSSDISVLNTMLAQEGLTEDELTRMRKERNL